MINESAVVGDLDWYGCDTCKHALAPHRIKRGGCDPLDNNTAQIEVDLDKGEVLCWNYEKFVEADVSKT